jgi:uncharacterized membrane protein YdjX (TVP38/TMEM64 family)
MSVMEAKIRTLAWPRALRKLATILQTSFFWRLATMVSLGLAARRYVAELGNPELLLERWGVLAPLVTVILQALTVSTPLGTSLIPILNGTLFPPALAIACSLVGGVLGATMMYAVWRRGERDLRIARGLERLPAWGRRFARADLRSLLALRLLPWAGGNLANLFAGSCRIPLRTHLLATTLGSLPGSIIYPLLGAGLVSL